MNERRLTRPEPDATESLDEVFEAEGRGRGLWRGRGLRRFLRMGWAPRSSFALRVSTGSRLAPLARHATRPRDAG